MKKQAIYIAALIAVTPAWAINKCTTDGEVVFQDAPCAAGTGGQIEVRPASGAGSSSSQDAVFANAMATGKIMIGMSATHVQRAWGSPDKINVSTGSYGRHEQWVYRRGNSGDQYVYLENGVVTSVQSPEGLASVPSPARGHRSRELCLTPHEVHDLETSASSITISEEERQRLQARIKHAHSCWAAAR